VSTFEKLAREVRAARTILDARRAACVALSRALPDFAFSGTRAELLRWSGADIRRGASFLGRVELVGPRGAARNLRVGPRVIVGPDVVFCLDDRIVIGRGASIGPRVMLYTATHPLGTTTRRMSLDVLARPITIDEGAWIGLGAIVLAGVRIGRGAVVSAGSVVTKDVAPNTLVAGNPAAIVEELPVALEQRLRARGAL
jgi:acetyltransferase-like isoleucine patch superfamily enzyme